MKVGVVFFHKNILNIYKKEWIDCCIESIYNQTFKDFIIYEINYGGSDLRIFDNSIYFSIEKINYADAMNFIITEAFNDGCDYVFNTNLDDFYSERRLQSQLEYLKMGFDIVSSDFCYVNADNQIFKHMNILRCGSISYNLNHDHNVIAHPVIGINKKFWLDEKNRYDINKTPAEDLDLWKRSINREYKFYIVDEVLLYYRIHDNQVSNYKKNEIL